MKRRSWIWMLMVLPITGWSWHSDAFSDWVNEFIPYAENQGIHRDIAEAALSGLTSNPEVVRLDGKQPEHKITFEQYLDNTVTPRRIRIGRALMKKHHALLKRIAATYRVQPEYLVALWGIESDYGAYKGNFSVIRSLATLAHDGRRQEFFSQELIAALSILQNESLTSYDLTGSWAGAMGDCQFMPSTYLHYAVDGDGDGHRDIWHSTPDILASIANYLHALGWRNDRGWGVEVELPEDFLDEEADLTQARSALAWRQRGVEWERTPIIPHNATPAYAIYVGDPAEASYLVTDNYKAILQWNRSRYFATAVGILANAIEE